MAVVFRPKLACGVWVPLREMYCFAILFCLPERRLDPRRSGYVAGSRRSMVEGAAAAVVVADIVRMIRYLMSGVQGCKLCEAGDMGRWMGCVWLCLAALLRWDKAMVVSEVGESGGDVGFLTLLLHRSTSVYPKYGCRQDREDIVHNITVTPLLGGSLMAS